ncbi:MAG: hypothetical protein KDK91_33100 [Gammaproteobacteria bacterium]|nr:hypothetical protein [Gammaproteobacteria bacterium]
MKPIQEYQVICHGVDHTQYFPGCGVCRTPFTDVAIGIGETTAEALDDALDQLAQGDWNVEHHDASMHAEHDDCCDLARAFDADEEINPELFVFVSVRVR